VPGTCLGEDSSIPTPRTSSGENGLILVSEATSRASARPSEPNSGLRQEIAAVVRPPSPEADWQKPISGYLWLGTIPNNEIKTQRLPHRSKGYLIHNDELYRRNTSGILQWCILPGEGRALHLDIHKGICGHHASSRRMVGKAFGQRFYWLTAVSNAAQIIRSCGAYQYFAKQIDAPAQGLHTIPVTWPFAVWGLNLLGPFKKVPRAILICSGR
jgi:hypothetical protein